MYFVALATFALVSQTLAGIVKNPCPTCPSYSTSFDANFDDIFVSVSATATQFINQYDALYWNSFVVGANTGVGVQLSSPPQFAGYGGRSQLSQGPASLTTIYQRSNVASYGLSSFYYGCALDSVEGAVGVPTACTITVTGYDSKNKVVGTKNLAYTPVINATTLSTPMMLASIGFKGIRYANFTTALVGSPVLGGLLGSLLDNVKYTVHYA